MGTTVFEDIVLPYWEVDQSKQALQAYQGNYTGDNGTFLVIQPDGQVICNGQVLENSYFDVNSKILYAAPLQDSSQGFSVNFNGAVSNTNSNSVYTCKGSFSGTKQAMTLTCSSLIVDWDGTNTLNWTAPPSWGNIDHFELQSSSNLKININGKEHSYSHLNIQDATVYSLQAYSSPTVKIGGPVVTSIQLQVPAYQPLSLPGVGSSIISYINPILPIGNRLCFASSLNLEQKPCAMIISNNTLFVMHKTTNQVFYFNLDAFIASTNKAAFKETHSFYVGGDYPQAFLIHNQWGFTADFNSGTVSYFKRDALPQDNSKALTLKVNVGAVALAAYKDWIFVANRGLNNGQAGHTISYFKTSDLLASNPSALIKTLEVGKRPTALLIAKNQLYVANSEENFISVFDITDSEVKIVKNIQLPKGFQNPVYLAKNPNDEDPIYVASTSTEEANKPLKAVYFFTENRRLFKGNIAVPSQRVKPASDLTFFNFNPASTTPSTMSTLLPSVTLTTTTMLAPK